MNVVMKGRLRREIMRDSSDLIDFVWKQRKETGKVAWYLQKKEDGTKKLWFLLMTRRRDTEPAGRRYLCDALIELCQICRKLKIRKLSMLALPEAWDGCRWTMVYALLDTLLEGTKIHALGYPSYFAD